MKRAVWTMGAVAIVVPLIALACGDDAQNASVPPTTTATTPPTGTGPSPTNTTTAPTPKDASTPKDANSGEDAGADAADADVVLDAATDAPVVDPALPTPTNVAIAFGLETYTVVTWDLVNHPDVIGYQVDFGSAANALTKHVVVDAATSFASAQTGTSGIMTYYTVRALYTNNRIGSPTAVVSAQASGIPPVTYPEQPGLRYLVQGGSMSRGYQFVSVTSVEGTTYLPIDTATVTVNGHAIPSTNNGNYYGLVDPTIDVGAAVNLSVTVGGAVVTASAVAPPMPTTTSPVAGAIIASNGNIPLAWTSATDPTRFTVSVTCGPEGGRIYLPGTARTATVSARIYPPGPCRVTIYSYADGTFTGPARLESAMDVREGSANVAFTIAAP